ncbi:hypothetical protein Stsp02_31630 [Streptomyces sp. NBRC 14336]|nr:hypothetical protein Stsp02_31630 [Streptomyces sp. NBRC 14336]
MGTVMCHAVGVTMFFVHGAVVRGAGVVSAVIHDLPSPSRAVKWPASGANTQEPYTPGGYSPSGGAGSFR